MGYRPDQHRLRSRKNRPGGFTIVELLITMAMIILLLSILTVAIASATRTSQSANTRALMNSIKQALARFKADIGYYPPVLDANRDLDNPWGPDGIPQPDGSGDDIDPNDWYTETALADYLIGYGNEQQDGHGDPADPNRPSLGIRHPGPDGVWLATRNGLDGSLGSRNIVGGNPFGRVYGPYLELKDERLMAFTDGNSTNGRLDVYFPGERLYNPNDPMVIVDYWGSPIRFYRRPYPPGALQSPYHGATLADVFVLRPFEIKPGAEVDGLLDGNNDPSTTYALRTAEVALFSPGPDRSFDDLGRRDEPAQFNADNIVELGP